MALIDEYKQAIQDVLDGRAKPAPKPSELPWSEDKAATMWAAAAAELIAEANSQGGGGGSDNIFVAHMTYHPDQMGDGSYTLDASFNDINAAFTAGKLVFAIGDGYQNNCLGVYSDQGLDAYYVYFSSMLNEEKFIRFEAMDPSEELGYYFS